MSDRPSFAHTLACARLKIVALAPKLGPLIRLLSSDQDGETGARAIMRTLKGGGTDIHALPDYLENPPFPAPQGSSAPTVTLADKVRYCAARADRLGEKERAFILQVLRTVNHGGGLSQKLGKWIADIYRRFGGRS